MWEKKGVSDLTDISYVLSHQRSDLMVVSLLCPPTVLHGNTQVKNAWRMNNIAKDKWIVIFAKNAEIKKQWMDAFQRERERVKEDMEKGRICHYFCCIISSFRAVRQYAWWHGYEFP